MSFRESTLCIYPYTIYSYKFHALGFTIHIALACNKSCHGPGCGGLSEFLRFTVTRSLLTHVINPSWMLITIPGCRYAKSWFIAEWNYLWNNFPTGTGPQNIIVQTIKYICTIMNVLLMIFIIVYSLRMCSQLW